MLRVGLTGGIASGKSAVGDIFADLGALVIDADALARYVVEPGQPALDEIVARFGPDIAPGGQLDRQALGALIFADQQAREDLNAIVHPRVRQVADDLERQCPDPYATVIHMIPLLVETGADARCDVVVVVDVSPETQIQRLRARDGLSEAEARARIDAQASRLQRLQVADFVINNEASLSELRPRVEAVWQRLYELQAPTERGFH